MSPPPTRGPAVTGRRTTAAVAFAVAKYVTCAAAVALGTMLFWCGASQQSGTAATAGRLGVSRLRPDAGPAAADANYPLWTDYHLSLARRFLTQEVYRELYGVVTPSGFSVDDAVQVAVDMPSGAEVTVGCYAGDVQSYTTFASLFDPVIEAVRWALQRGVHPVALPCLTCTHCFLWLPSTTTLRWQTTRRRRTWDPRRLRCQTSLPSTCCRHASQACGRWTGLCCRRR